MLSHRTNSCRHTPPRTASGGMPRQAGGVPRLTGLCPSAVVQRSDSVGCCAERSASHERKLSAGDRSVA